MKFSLLIPLVGLACLAVPAHADLLIQPHDVVLVSVEVPVMAGTVSVDIADYLLMCQPVEGVRVVQSSLREDAVEPFMKRVDTDIKPWRPTVTLISHTGGDGNEGASGRNLSYYHPTYQAKAIEELKAIGVRTVVLGSSGCVDSFYFHANPDQAKTWNENLAAFRDSDRQIAEKSGCIFANLYDPMMDVMPKAKAAYGEKYNFAGDDPNGTTRGANGQLIMAYAFLKALGCDGAIGTITVDLAANKAEATTGHKIISCKDGTVEVESTRYPFCFRGKPTEPDATTGLLTFFPFNEDLNRYLLVVKGLKGSSAKVTWGTQTKTFPVADLEKGVNLAAAFAAATPFDSQFFKVQDALWKQQSPESLYTDSMFRNIEAFKKMAPTAIAAIDQISAAIIEQDKALAAEAAALVIPIRHTIKIEAQP